MSSLAVSDMPELFQSTHPRRVRHKAEVEKRGLVMFQSTHPRRVRLEQIEAYEAGILFQSTHPRRVRPIVPISNVTLGTCFNPRTHVGCDLFLILKFIKTEFQSTHPRRVRHKSPCGIELCTKVSIHAPTSGAT